MHSIHSFSHSTTRTAVFPRVFGTLRRRGGMGASCSVLALMLGGAWGGAYAQAGHFSGAQSVVATTGLSSPAGVAVDGSGNVYIADPNNGRVLKETPSVGGYVQSFVVSNTNGGYSPVAVAVDGNGNVYIAFSMGSRVLKEAPSANGYTESVVANAASNGLEAPVGVAVDNSGNVYISDENDGLILKETLKAGSYSQSVIANSATNGLSAPNSVAVDSSGNVYIADSGNNRVLKETLSAGSYTQSVVANAATNGLDFPKSVAIDGSGNVYIVDFLNNLVLKETLSSGSYTQSVIANYATNGLVDSSAVAVGGNGNVYIADKGNNRVLKETSSGGNFGTVNVGSTSTTPISMIFTFDTAGTPGSTTVVTQGATGLDFANAGTGTCKAGTAYTAGETCTVEVNFTPKFAGTRYGAVEFLNSIGYPVGTGYFQGTGVGPQLNFMPGRQSVVANSANNGLVSPKGVAVDSSGNVYIADTTHTRVLKETPSVGSYTQSVVTDVSTQVPEGVAVDGSGAVYVADSVGLWKELPYSAGYQESFVPTDYNSNYAEPDGATVDGSGNIYIADTSNNRVLKDTLTAGGSYALSEIRNGLNSPAGIAVDGNGNLYVADTGNNRVLKETLTAGGSYTQSIIISGLNSPAGIAVDGSGNVYIADTSNSRVLKETLSAGSYTQSVIANATANGLSEPYAVAVDGSGNVYISDTGNNRVLKEDFTDPPSLTFATTDVGATSTDSPKTVTLVNGGNAALSFPPPASGSNPSISANFTLNSSESSACPLIDLDSASPGVLAAGESCLLPISFSPTTGGLLSGSLVLTDNALNASGATQSIELSGTGIGKLPVLTTPTPGSTLPGQSVTFTWTAAASGSQGYWLFLGTTGVGSKDLLDTGLQTATSATFSNLPTDGATIYARVYTRYGGVLVYNDYTYKAWTQLPVLTSPTPGGTLPGTSATFTWTAESGSAGYWLFLGTTGAGSKNLFDSNEQKATSATFSNLPTNGETIYARVYTSYNGTLVYNDYTYKAAAQAVLTTPTPGSTLTGSSATFSWTPATGSGNQGYWLILGLNGVGSRSLYDSGQQTATSATFNNLPTNGATIYARVYTSYNGVLVYNDYTYKAK